MILSGKPVLFRLTSQGQRALQGLVPRTGSFPAYVIDTDLIGAWILPPSKRPKGEPKLGLPIMLLKWDYVASAAHEFRPERPPAPKRMGFEPHSHGQKPGR